MIRQVIFSVALLISSIVAMAETVEYVKVCSLPGAGYFYLPGKDTCLNASTGVMFTATVNGEIYSESQLAKRVSQLEAEIEALEGLLD